MALLEGREWLGGPPGGPGVVGKPSCRSEVVGRPFRRSGSDRETLPEVRELSGGHPVGPGVFGRPFERDMSGRKILPEGQ